MSWLTGLAKGATSLLGTVGKAAFGFAKANPYVAASMALGAILMILQYIAEIIKLTDDKDYS